MTISKSLMALVTGLWLGFAGPAAAIVELPTIDLTVGDVSGLSGSVVHPTVSFPVNGFVFDSLTLALGYDNSVLTFLPASSTVTYNGITIGFESLPNLVVGTKQAEFGVWTERYGSFADPFLTPPAITGTLLLTGAFQIMPRAAAGSYPIQATGFISTGPFPLEEPEFSHAVTVSVVPEPEIWLLWISGIGLLAARSARRRNKTSQLTHVHHDPASGDLKPNNMT